MGVAELFLIAVGLSMYVEQGVSCRSVFWNIPGGYAFGGVFPGGAVS